jgi:hypothetical protein
MGESVVGVPDNVLNRIQRGLVGYISYLAACEANEAFSEYVLYEPIVRILLARGFTVQSEVEAPVPQPARGDKKRLDFVFVGPDGSEFALEVKWAKAGGPADAPRPADAQPWTLDVSADYEKLAAFAHAPRRSFLCVFARDSHLNGMTLDPANFVDLGSKVTASFGTTAYSCLMFETHPPN